MYAKSRQERVSNQDDCTVMNLKAKSIYSDNCNSTRAELCKITESSSRNVLGENSTEATETTTRITDGNGSRGGGGVGESGPLLHDTSLFIIISLVSIVVVFALAVRICKTLHRLAKNNLNRKATMFFFPSSYLTLADCRSLVVLVVVKRYI